MALAMERFENFSLGIYNPPKVNDVGFQIGDFLEHLTLISLEDLIFDKMEFFVDSVKFYKRTLLQFCQDVEQEMPCRLAHEAFLFVFIEIALVKKRLERDNGVVVIGDKKVFADNDVEFCGASMAVGLAVDGVVVHEKEIVWEYFYLCSPSPRNEFVHHERMESVGFLQVLDVCFFGVFNVYPRHLRTLNDVSHSPIVPNAK